MLLATEAVVPATKPLQIPTIPPQGFLHVWIQEDKDSILKPHIPKAATQPSLHRPGGAGFQPDELWGYGKLKT